VALIKNVTYDSLKKQAEKTIKRARDEMHLLQKEGIIRLP